jgi:arsenite methyltransferase
MRGSQRLAHDTYAQFGGPARQGRGNLAQHRGVNASSTGQDMTGAEWLDVHFEACRPEYESQLRAVGIQPGWRVLDAACGSGSFIPCLADLVGSTGSIAVLDLAPDNVALVERRMSGWNLSCPVKARIGSVVDLPYPDGAFDAVWFANTSQYLTDAELATTLVEFQRVVRPGGLVAVKDSDLTMYRTIPDPPGLMLRWFQASASGGNVQAAGLLRVGTLPAWLRRAGLLDVWQRATMIERSAPLNPASRAVWHGAFQYLSTGAPDLDLPPADHHVWSQFTDPAALDRFLDDPDCWLIDCNILAVGTVPDAAGASG